MERDGWLIAVIGFVAVGAPVLLFVAVRLVGLGIEGDPAVAQMVPTAEVSLDPGRAVIGVVVAVLLVAAAGWVIRRTDWSSPEG